MCLFFGGYPFVVCFQKEPTGKPQFCGLPRPHIVIKHELLFYINYNTIFFWKWVSILLYVFQKPIIVHSIDAAWPEHFFFVDKQAIYTYIDSSGCEKYEIKQTYMCIYTHIDTYMCIYEYIYIYTLFVCYSYIYIYILYLGFPAMAPSSPAPKLRGSAPPLGEGTGGMGGCGPRGSRGFQEAWGSEKGSRSRELCGPKTFAVCETCSFLKCDERARACGRPA